MKIDFKIVVDGDEAHEDCVKARLSQWPDALYTEEQLKKLEDSPCIGEAIKGVVFQARMAILKEKSDRGFLSRRHKLAQQAGAPEDSKPKTVPKSKSSTRDHEHADSHSRDEDQHIEPGDEYYTGSERFTDPDRSFDL